MMKIKIKQPNNKGSHQHTMMNVKEIQILDEKDIATLAFACVCVFVYSVDLFIRRFQRQSACESNPLQLVFLFFFSFFFFFFCLLRVERTKNSSCSLVRVVPMCSGR